MREQKFWNTQVGGWMDGWRKNKYPNVNCRWERKGTEQNSEYTLHLISSVSSRLISTSSPPTSRIASWHVSCPRLKSLIAHNAIIVAVWFPPWKITGELSETKNVGKQWKLYKKNNNNNNKSNNRKTNNNNSNNNSSSNNGKSRCDINWMSCKKQRNSVSVLWHNIKCFV